MSNELTRANKITVGGGLHSRLKAAEVLKEIAPQIDPKTLPNRLAIIADFSGSMESHVNGANKTKLQLLSEAVQDFALRSNPSDTAIAVESFPRGFRIDLTNDPQQVYMRMMSISTIGDTPMAEGMSNALEYHSPTRAMLISDGEATDRDASYGEAQRYKNKEIICDCVHIGDSSGGEERLKRIAEITRGMYLKFKDVSSFSQNFHYLLPEARAAIAGMLPYERANLLGADEVK
jgi:Mg-chelatase subunit ChlD